MQLIIVFANDQSETKWKHPTWSQLEYNHTSTQIRNRHNTKYRHRYRGIVTPAIRPLSLFPLHEKIQKPETKGSTFCVKYCNRKKRVTRSTAESDQQLSDLITQCADCATSRSSTSTSSSGSTSDCSGGSRLAAGAASDERRRRLVMGKSTPIDFNRFASTNRNYNFRFSAIHSRLRLHFKL